METAWTDTLVFAHKIPNDRITDGVDQTSLFLNGGGHSRRNFIAHYSGDVLGAIRREDFKMHIKAAQGGLPGMDFYNVMRDPGDKYSALYGGLFAVAPIQVLMRQHMPGEKLAVEFARNGERLSASAIL